MSFSYGFDAEFVPIYVDLGNSLGAYVVEPGEKPFITLHNSLKEKHNEPTANYVYHALLTAAKSLPAAYHLFPLTLFFEDLPAVITKPVTARVQPVQPEIIIFGRATRQWHYPVYLPDEFRLIG